MVHEDFSQLGTYTLIIVIELALTLTVFGLFVIASCLKNAMFLPGNW